jgi:hypothetical protein
MPDTSISHVLKDAVSAWDDTIYTTLVPPNVCEPYVVVDVITDGAWHTTCNTQSVWSVQLRCVAGSQGGLDSCVDLQDSVRDTFDDRTVSETGYKLYWSYRSSWLRFDPRSQLWVGWIMYDVWESPVVA